MSMARKYFARRLNKKLRATKNMSKMMLKEYVKKFFGLKVKSRYMVL
jgi:hypothetical protein